MTSLSFTKNQQEWGNFASSLVVPRLKSFQLQGPLLRRHCAGLWTLLGAKPLDHYRLQCSFCRFVGRFNPPPVVEDEHTLVTESWVWGLA